MRSPILHALLWVALLFSLTAAKSSWSFQDATVSIVGKSTGSDSTTEKLTPSSPLANPLSLSSTSALKIALTATENKKAKRPHQAFLNFKDSVTGLVESFPLAIKESGKGKLDLSQRDLPYQLLASSEELQASIIIASFGDSEPLNVPLFKLNAVPAANSQVPIVEKPMRYGKLEEIYHTFRADPKSPPVIINLVFTAAALAVLPALLAVWLFLGANVNHLSEAFGTAPVSHALFVGSIFALEGIFFLYYSSWNLMQTLPAVAVIGSIAFLSGSKALSEVQQRRLVGKR